MSKGKHDSGQTSDSEKSGKGGTHGGTEWDRKNSFGVPSKERVERGIGDQQTGGRDDY